MNSVHKHFLLPFVLLLLFSVYTGSCLGWDPAVQENVIIFDETGELTGSYHTGDWAGMVDASGKITFEHWTGGSPPSLESTDTTPISLAASQVAVPNFTSQASTPPPAGVPEVSLYSFDAAFFSSINPGDIPALSVSHPSGTYKNTIGLEITAKALTGTATIELKNNADVWEAVGDSSAIIYISRDRILTVRAVNNGAYSPERVLSYTIDQPILIDSDGDGIPDIWEIAHGLNPLDNSTDSAQNSPDSDGDSFSDVDEVLRGSDPLNPDDIPIDTDGDKWSDWDEEFLRGTDPLDPLDKPTATRLYEVETLLSGQVRGYNDALVATGDYRIETLQQRMLAEGASSDLAVYSSKIPLGSEAVIRVVDPLNNGFIYKRYIRSVADPLFSDLGFDEADCTGDILTWHEQWQAALVEFLAASLVTATPDFHVTTSSMLPVGLLERQLEILSNSVPAEVVAEMEILYPELNSLPWLAFSSHGHRPESNSILLLQQILEKERPPTWGAASPQNKRSINSLIDDFENMALSSCHSLQIEINNFYSVMTPDELIEEEVSRLLQEQDGTYLAGLLMLYSLESLSTYPAELCTVFSSAEDLDSDGLLNHEETPVQDLISGLANPFLYDSDNDGWLDNQDNCPLVANVDQHDWDGDATGDACDSDDDNDGLSDAVESAFGSNPYAGDTDNDDVADGQEWLNGEDPGITVFLTDYNSPTNQPSQVITGYREADSDIFVTIGNDATSGTVTFPSATSWQCELAAMTTEGNYQLTLNGSDSGAPIRVGVTYYTFTVDTTAPLVSIATPADGSFTTENNPPLEYTISDGRWDMSLDGSTIALASGQRLPPLAPGSHQLEITGTDLAGNQNTQYSTFVVPDLPIGDLSGDDSVDLTDLVLILQVLTDQTTGDALADRYIPGGDDRWGLEEALLIINLLGAGQAL